MIALLLYICGLSMVGVGTLLAILVMLKLYKGPAFTYEAKSEKLWPAFVWAIVAALLIGGGASLI